MLIFPDPAVSTEYTDPNGSVWEFNGTGWVRQPESSGGGGEDFAWPLPSKAEVEIFALPSGNNRPDGVNYESLLLQADPVSGALSVRETAQFSAAADTRKIKFANQRKLLAVPSGTSRLLQIYSYETVPATLVDSISIGRDIDDFCWGLTDEVIVVCCPTGRYRAYKESGLGNNDWSGNLFSAETTLTARCYSIDAVKTAGCGTSVYFMAAVFAQSADKNIFLLEATSSGIREVSSFATGSYQYEVDNHPHVGGAIRCGNYNSASGSPGGTIYVLTDREEVKPAYETQFSNSANANLANAIFSPSGNYAFLHPASGDDQATLVKVSPSGVLTKVWGSFINRSANCRAQWSSDERFMYIWSFFDSPAGPNGERAIVRTYDFNDGAPTQSSVPDFYLQWWPIASSNPRTFDRCRV